MNIQQIIASCKKKNPSAQRELVDLFSGTMLSIARRYLNNDHLAYDVLQESWINIFEKINTFDDRIGSFEAWMYRIVVNQSLKELKRRKTRIDFLPEYSMHPVENEPEIFSVMNTEILFKLIQNLPAGCREIFNMFVIDNFSHVEISKILNISEGTSRSQLNRARKILMEKILSMNKEKAISA